MKLFSRSLAVFAAAIILGGGLLLAQDATGDWQGTTSEKLRVILQIRKGDDGTLKGVLYSIDQSPTPVTADQLTLTGTALKLTISAFHMAYEGTLSPDGKMIRGTLTQGKSNPLVFERASKETAWQTDSSPHRIQFVMVEPEVKLEILDWGGTGRPLVLLTGLGDTAHVYDTFASKLTGKYHVYGITRRGFGASSSPPPASANYRADRLGNDVLAVIEALRLDHPIVAGHSIAGQELSFIGMYHPEKVAGLIYLDAGYPYALYDEAHGSMYLDAVQLREQLANLGMSQDDPRKVLDDLLASLQRVEKELAQQKEDWKVVPPPSGSKPKISPVIAAIQLGQQKFVTIHAPALLIFAIPHDFGPSWKDKPEARNAIEAADQRRTEKQIEAFETQVPSAHIVRLQHANHYVFRSNESDVLREMNAFISTLPQ